ncbi:hypothetical protein BC936DRAFT_137280, partial [Jimgerdemannia flammicorona]
MKIKDPNNPKTKAEAEELKSRRYIHVLVELPRRTGKKRPDLVRFDDNGDLVIIVDDRNVKEVYGSAVKSLVEEEVARKIVANAAKKM